MSMCVCDNFAMQAKTKVQSFPIYLLKCIETYHNANMSNSSMTQRKLVELIQKLYDNDIIDDCDLENWYHLKPTSDDIRKKVKPFMDWLSQPEIDENDFGKTLRQPESDENDVQIVFRKTVHFSSPLEI